jgi:hypothetical protein
MNVEHTELKREGHAQSATATWYGAGPEPTGDAFGNSVSALLAVPKSEADAAEAKRPKRASRKG